MEPGRDSHLVLQFSLKIPSIFFRFVIVQSRLCHFNKKKSVVLRITYFQIQAIKLLVLMLDQTQPPTIIYGLYVVPLHSNNNKKSTIINHTLWQIIQFLLKQGERTHTNNRQSICSTVGQHWWMKSTLDQRGKGSCHQMRKAGCGRQSSSVCCTTTHCFVFSLNLTFGPYSSCC